LADIDETQQSEVIRITNSDEDQFVGVNSISELSVNDTTQQGTDIILNLTTTAQEIKVGVSALSNRKYIFIEALTKNVKWGFTTDCIFSLPKKGFYIIPLGENATVFAKASTGTAQLAAGEA
jgi:hypothetical protein